MSIDQQFVEYVVKSLVTKPDEVKVERRIDEKGVLIELTVDPEDLGRVIGKRGATAQSIRTLLRALGTKNDARYNLKIVDNGVGSNRSNDDERKEGAWGESNDDKKAEEPKEEPAEDTSTDEVEDTEDAEEEESDSLKKAREDLADLDDDLI